MVTRIHSIGTATPKYRLSQAATRDFFIGQPGVDRLTSRLIGAAFDHSAIEGRYTVIGELTGGAGPFVDDSGALRVPTTGERNAVYRSEAPALFAAAARGALERAGVSVTEVTHVVTASCTGFFAPGPDFKLVQDLGIPPTAQRVHIGFMGCAAAFPALRTAAHICAAQPDAVVLVACGEICSLHIRASSDPEQIVASAVFADGAAAAIVSATPARSDSPVIEMGAFGTAITSDGESDMDWTIGDQGFEMRLTSEVPRIIGREIAGVVRSMLGENANPTDSVDAWAVHPGGRSVLDRVQAGLGLPDSALDDSRAVLRNYGNMSSATVLFILQRMLAAGSLNDGAQIAGLAFGPGLTVETARFTLRAPHTLSAASTRAPPQGAEAQ
ncbi:type III polyketide synthase [Leucobacter sp. W1478]|uniref:type III polyketide synthase n=1 Tax=Leucobacter sp. W1478 TaxID=3439065 RepID=UPI003F30B7AF